MAENQDMNGGVGEEEENEEEDRFSYTPTINYDRIYQQKLYVYN